MLFAGQEVRIGKNCARGLEYGPRPNTDRPRPANNVFIFFSLENYFIRNIFVHFLMKQFHTVRVRSSKPMFFTEVLKRRVQFSLILN